jgi:hypothetical protein
MSVSLPSFAALKILMMSSRARSSSSRYWTIVLCPRTVTSSGCSAAVVASPDGAESAWASARPETMGAELSKTKATER